MKRLLLVCAGAAILSATAQESSAPAAPSPTATKAYVERKIAAAAQAATNYTAEAIAAIPQPDPPDLSGFVTTNALATATNGLLRAETDPKFNAWKGGNKLAAGDMATASGSWSLAVGPGSGPYTSTVASGASSVALGTDAQATKSFAVAVGPTTRATEDYAVVVGKDAVSHGIWTVNLGKDGLSPSKFYFGSTNLQTYLDAKAPSNHAHTNYATTAALAEKADKVDVQNVYNFITGTGVWFSVTNYMRTTSAIPTMSLYEIDGGTNKLVWSQTEGMAKSLRDANAYTDEAIIAADIPDKAWALYTSGLGIPAPSNTTWVSTPQTVLAGGLEYARTVTASGSYWFLVSNGMVAQVADTNGYLRIVDDSGESGFTIRKTNSYVVGAAIDRIEITPVNGYNHVRLTFPVVSSEHPILETSPTLSPPAFSTNINATVTWSGASGAWIADVDLQSQYDQHFFKASVTVPGKSVVEMDKPLSAASGILCTDGIHKVRPVWNNGTITWEVVP